MDGIHNGGGKCAPLNTGTQPERYGIRVWWRIEWNREYGKATVWTVCCTMNVIKSGRSRVQQPMMSLFFCVVRLRWLFFFGTLFGNIFGQRNLYFGFGVFIG